MTVTQNRELLRQQADEEKANQLWEQIFEDDSKICDFLTKDITGVWKQLFDTVGYISITIGDEPENCSSRVYKDHHREIVRLDKDGTVEIIGKGSDYDWENAEAYNYCRP